jgi:omega-amidase
MKITFIQTALHWEDRDKNLAHFDERIKAIGQETHVIVLPEMFTTGFSMVPEKVSEPANGPAFEWMKEKAAETRAAIVGSVAVKEDGHFYNRLYWVEPTGNWYKYDKRHLFRIAGEDRQYSAGNERMVIEFRGWRFMPLICYDLRFPVWSRNRFVKNSPTSSEAEYDVLIYVANWPATRVYPWKHLLIARAIENQAFVVGVNRVGKDGHGYDHNGDSMVISFKGEVLSEPVAGVESIQTIDLDRDPQDEFRAMFPVGIDADDFSLKIR